MQLMIEALIQGMERTGSRLLRVTEPRPVLDVAALATSLESASVAMAGQAGHMRAADHQFQQPLVVAVMGKLGQPGVPFDVEGSGYGFRVLRTVSAQRAEQPQSCQMQRP
jgi:branched-chain amino acid transport system substrate-binding protein